jgi:hypothetical protein
MILSLSERACRRELLPVFPEPTARRFVVLLASAILTRGRHTIANLRRTGRALAPDLLPARPLGRPMVPAPTRRCRHPIPGPARPARRAGPAGRRRSRRGAPRAHVDGKARHRDPVRSTRADTAWKYGHRGVVLAVLVRFPGTSRPWALPLLIDLYRSPELDRQRHRPPRTPPQLMMRRIRLLLRWFPARSWVFVGDGNSGTHELARFGHRHRDRLARISKFHPRPTASSPRPATRVSDDPESRAKPFPSPLRPSSRP